MRNGTDGGSVVVPQSRSDGGGDARVACLGLNANQDIAPATTGDPAVPAMFQIALLGPLLDTRHVVFKNNAAPSGRIDRLLGE